MNARHWGVTALKVVLSLGLLAWLLSRQPLGELEAAVRRPAWSWLVVSLAVYGISALAGAWQWGWLLRGAGLATPWRLVLRLYLVGLFFNNFLPANVGGDIYKIFDLGRREHDASKVFAATLMDRLLGLSALTVVAILAAGIAVGRGIALPPVAWLLLAVLALLGGSAVLLLSRRLGPRLPPLLRRLRLPTIAGKIGAIVDDVQTFRRQLPLLAALMGFSGVLQVLRILTHVLVAMGLHMSLSGTQVLQLYVLVPMLAISLTLPVTINGIGLRETVSSYLLPWAGLGQRAVVAMEMVAFLVMIAFSLVGGIMFWTGRQRSGTPVTRAG